MSRYVKTQNDSKVGNLFFKAGALAQKVRIPRATLGCMHKIHSFFHAFVAFAIPNPWQKPSLSLWLLVQQGTVDHCGGVDLSHPTDAAWKLQFQRHGSRFHVANLPIGDGGTVCEGWGLRCCGAKG